MRVFRREPPDDQVLIQRCGSIGLAMGPAAARRACQESDLWIGEQILREMHGEARLPDEQLVRYLDRIALKAAFPAWPEVELERWTECLHAAPQISQTWKLAASVLETLARLHARRFRLGVVSNFDESLPRLFQELGLEPYFEITVVSALVGVEKPGGATEQETGCS